MRDPPRTPVLHETREALRELRWQILVYGVGIAAWAALAVWLFPHLEGLLEAPAGTLAYRVLFGEAGESFAGARSYLTLQFFAWMPVITASYAIVASTGLLAREERPRERPLTRRRLLLERTVALAIGAVLICALGALGFAVSAPFVRLGDVTLRELVVATFNLAPLMLACAGLGLVVAAVSPTRGVAARLVALETIVVYFANTLSSLADWLEPLRYLSPFFYADVSVALNDGIEAWHVAVLLGAFALLTALAVRAFEARELDAARWQLRAVLGRGVQAPP